MRIWIHNRLTQDTHLFGILNFVDSVSWRRWISFIREGFAIDYLHNLLFDSFVLNWISRGALKLNFVFINFYQSNLLYTVSNISLNSLLYIPNSGLGFFFSVLSYSIFLIGGVLFIV